MVEFDGKPLVSEAEARADLASEFGTIYANYRNLVLENAALVRKLGEAVSCIAMLQNTSRLKDEQLAKVTAQHEELANQLRGKVLPARRKV
jgi:hypothetical protein